MKKLILLSGLLIAGMSINAQSAAKTQTAASQNKVEDPAVKATRQTEALFQTLGLTADQKSKIYSINLEKNTAVNASQSKNATDAKAFENERKVINAERENAIKAILTPEQQAKMKAQKEANKERKSENSNVTK